MQLAPPPGPVFSQPRSHHPPGGFAALYARQLDSSSSGSGALRALIKRQSG
jgi:hypothetical protein